MKTVTLTQNNRVRLLALYLALFCLSVAPVWAATRRAVLSSGTVVPVRLDKALNSKTAHEGDRVSVTVRSGDDDATLPEGTRFEGVVREVQPASGDKPGVLDIDFRRMTTPGGQDRAFNGSVISLDAKNVERSDSGRLTAKVDKNKDRLKFIGIGAGAGLVIGSLSKGNTFTSTLLGAAAGYLYNEFGNKPKPSDVDLKAGSEFGVRVDREFAFQTNQIERERPAIAEPENDQTSE